MFESKFRSALSIAAVAFITASCSNLTTVDSAELNTYAEISDTRPGNITVTQTGRVIITQQPLDAPALRAVEVLADGTKIPFPNQDWADGPEYGDVGITASIGITTDSQGVVWILDMGSADAPVQFVAWDTVADKLHTVIKIPAEVIRPISFLQDFVYDEKRGQLIIADMTFTAPDSAALPAFIVVDVDTGTARRVLESDPLLMPVDHNVVIEGALMGFKSEDGEPVGWNLGLNPIAIDPNAEYVYFGTVNGRDIFRLPAAAFADNSLDDVALSAQIERYAEKRPSDGFIVDAEGRVYSGDIEASGIGVSTPEGYRLLVQDSKRLAWVDGFALDKDGTLYITQNQLNTHPALNFGEDVSLNSYHILTLKP